MRVEVWSDVVCPWCFLGKRRLGRAIASLPWGDEVEVRWRAFQLDPRATAAPGDLRASIERKYGPGAFDSMVGRLTALGEAEGIDYRFDRAVRVGTRDAHRLAAWAWARGGATAQERVVEGLFGAYFERGANVADHDVLAVVAEAAALDADEARRVLGGDDFGDEVDADLAAAAARDITGVPTFVLADRVAVPGAQDAETLAALLARVRTRLAGGGAGAARPA